MPDACSLPAILLVIIVYFFLHIFYALLTVGYKGFFVNNQRVIRKAMTNVLASAVAEVLAAAGGRTSKAARATGALRGQKRCDRRGEEVSEPAAQPPSPVVLHTDDPLPAETKGEPGSQGGSLEAPTTH